MAVSQNMTKTWQTWQFSWHFCKKRRVHFQLQSCILCWSHSMDNISTHQTRTIIQFKLPQRKCFTKNLKIIIIIIIHRKITTLLSYGSKILLAYFKATSQSYAKSKTIKIPSIITFCALGTCTWLKSILGFNQYSVTSILPTSI